MSNCAIWPIDRTLSGAITPGQSEPWSDGNEGVLLYTMHIHLQTTQYKTQADSVVQIQTHLLTSGFGSLTRGERQFLKVFHNHTMLTTPPTFTHLVVQFLNTMVGPNFNCLPLRQTTQLSAYIVQNQLPILFFKIFKFSRPLLPGMTLFTLQLHFLSGVYYDNCDCYILCTQA